MCETLTALQAKNQLAVDHYMPAATRWRRIRVARKATVREKFDRALFPGIVFVWCFPAHFQAVKALDDVIEFYSIRNAAGEGRPAPLPAVAINQIRQRQAQGEFDETCPKHDGYRPAIGDKAFVEDTDWVSQIGEIVKIKPSQGTATLIIDGRRVKTPLKTLRPEPTQQTVAT